MKKNFRRKIPQLVEGLLNHLKGFVLALIAVISVLGIIVGYKYYRHTQDDPEFCMACHMMKEAYVEWQRGKHRDVVCQKCHYLSLIEQNQLLISYVVKGKSEFAGAHGRKTPWAECKTCHLNEISQGSLTLRKSYGHAKHVFMQNIECKVCHSGSRHRFKPNENACQNCHRDKGVHGVGMEAFSCLKCHSFIEKSPAMVPNDKCIGCHKIVMGSPMANFKCLQCHHPHGKIKLKSADCLGECHGNEAKVGQHDFHMKKGMECLDCHKAHMWIVGKKEARGLCNRCHALKDPKTFLY